MALTRIGKVHRLHTESETMASAQCVSLEDSFRAVLDENEGSDYDSSGCENGADSDEEYRMLVNDGMHLGEDSDTSSEIAVGGEEMVIKEEAFGDIGIKIDTDDWYYPLQMSTEQPAMPDCVWYRANREQPIVHAFTGNAGIQVDVTNFRPINFFELYVNEDLINHFVIQTNLMASQFIENHPNLPRYSNVRCWVDTNPAEMKLFLGIVLLMGIDKKPKIPDYWSGNPLHHTPIFSSVMPRNRFQLLLKFWHFNDNTHAPPRNEPNRDRMYKLRPLIDHLYEQFQTVYTPTQDVCVDDSLLLWKGSLVFRQRITVKSARSGIRINRLCESGGYTYRFNVYTGKDDPTNNVDTLLPYAVRDFTLTEKCVLYIALPLLDQGYCLWMDDRFTSTRLFSYLYLRSTNTCGIISDNRLPLQFREDIVPEKEIVAYRSEPMLCIRFHDNDTRTILTTIHTEETQRVNVCRTGRRRSQPVNKPVAMVMYEANMAGMDLQAKMIQPFSAARKTMKWYKKLAIHMIQIAMFNAYLLYQKASAENKKSFQEFQDAVISSLVFEGGAQDVRHQNQANPDLERLTGRHFLGTLQPTATWTKPQARCRVCSKNKRRRDVKTVCVTCAGRPGLCIDCFLIYHTVMDY